DRPSSGGDFPMTARSSIRNRFARTRRTVRNAPALCRRFLEALEDRTLLASSLVYQAVDDTPLTLLLAGGKLEVVQTANPKAVLASNLLKDVTAGVQIHGNGHNVPLTIDASLPSGIPGGVLFDGGS